MGDKLGNRLRLMYIADYIQKKTDDSHGVTLQQINAFLENMGCKANRKTLYADIEQLKKFGWDISCRIENKTYIYRLESRKFELAELKLLVDSVQASKFITEKKSRTLIEKLGSLTSEYQEKELKRQVHVMGRLKRDNENIYYNVDQIHSGINNDVSITFQYFQWDVRKQKVMRHQGELYQVSPWALLWEDENYYLIGFDHRDCKIKHYRVDKMLHIELQKSRRQGKDCFNDFDLASYTKKIFGMFAGDEYHVVLKLKNHLAGVAIDRFGLDVSIHPIDEEWFRLSTKVEVSNQFFGWLFALGDEVEVCEPPEVVEQMREMVDRVRQVYGE